MQRIELTEEELEMLRSLLKHYVDEVAVELGHTATREFRVMLKHRSEVLGKVLEKLPEPVPA